jgi:FkbH-like protein
MLIDLDWLPRPVDDFRARVRAVEGAIGAIEIDELYERVVGLATAALDDAQLAQLARLSRRLSQAGVGGQFGRARLGLLGDGTLSLYAAPIVASGLRHGLIIDIVEGDYGAAVQEAMDRSSALHTAGLDFALLSSDRRALGLDVAAPSADVAEARVQAAFDRLRMIVEGLSPSLSSAVLVQTVVPPLEGLFGSFDRLEPTSSFAMVDALNRRIAAWAATGSVVLADAARLAGAVGLANWEDPAHWHASKLSFSPSLTPLYGDFVARTIAAIRGRSRKCLVLDLDNTLWGGVIGDDGVGGIVLGQNSAAGEAFVAIQRMALELRSRGVVLAVCSKNEDDAARLPFREHPEMVLSEDHIAVFQANWTDKAANLRVIAQTLNIGLDSLVFLDDNPAERLQVRGELPLVAVPEVGAEPALYPRILAAAGYFEAVSFSQEDRDRAAYYQANAQRAAALSATGNLDDYLASLGMVCSIGRVDAVSRTRSSQLINKSNQFNLTTRRYSEREVEAVEKDPSKHAIQVRLTDRFGDNGIISVIIAERKAEAWEIDTWLMSCRVLGRRVPEAALGHLVEAARRAGARALIGRYVPSPKNKMVAGHYEGLGFQLESQGSEGETVWRLELAGLEIPTLPMTIVDTALEAPAPAET